MCKRTTMWAFILLVLSGAVLLLGACHTVDGAD
jgi:predicted small secreted protein